MFEGQRIKIQPGKLALANCASIFRHHVCARIICLVVGYPSAVSIIERRLTATVRQMRAGAFVLPTEIGLGSVWPVESIEGSAAKPKANQAGACIDLAPLQISANIVRERHNRVGGRGVRFIEMDAVATEPPRALMSSP